MIGVLGSSRAAAKKGKAGNGETTSYRGNYRGAFTEDSDDDDDVLLSVLLKRQQEQELPSTIEEQMPRSSEESVTEKVNGVAQVYDLDSESEPELEEVPSCPDPEFHDFEKDRSENCLGVDQIWAMYDDFDKMPRWYGRVRKVLSLGSKLLMTWLEACPGTKDGLDRRDEAMPVSCGVFKTEGVDIVDRVSLSHRMDCSRGKDKDTYFIFPKKGETWALFKDWDIKWGCEPEKHKPQRTYDLVEVMSDFAEEVGVEVCYLCKVEGFVSIYEKSSHETCVSFFILPNEVLFSFSHRVPSCRMTGREKEGVPAGSFELDTAALPSGFCNVEQVVSIRPQGGSGSFMAKEKISSPRNCGTIEFRDALKTCPIGLSQRGRGLSASKFVDLESGAMLMSASTWENRAQTSDSLHERVERSTSQTGTTMSLKRKVINGDRLASKKPRSKDEVMSQSCMIDGDEDQVTADYGYVNKKLDLKRTELATLEERVKACKMELERTQASLEHKQGELLEKNSCLHSIEELIKETNLKLELRENQYKAIRRSIGQSSAELQSKESQLKSLEQSIKESMEKEKALRYVKDEVRESCEVVQSKEKELNELKKCIEASNKVLDEKLKLLGEIKAKLANNTGKLKSMEEHRNRLKKSIMDLRQKRDHYHSVQKPSQGHSAVESRTHEILHEGYATNLQLFLDKHLRKHDAFQAEVSIALQRAPDPAMLVLEVMHEFYPRSENRDMDYDLSVTRRTCITLLEHLLGIKPHIKSDVLGFLQLVSAFRLASDFSADEVRQLVSSGLSKQGNGAETWQSLGVMDN
ncbi:unnamed protein product [Linum trigynum]|uniref:FRIGIDA-like protein n=1 Tax=Linum trigynum TaxID=586398 RepID=A0AAV2CJF4_9ROSI